MKNIHMMLYKFIKVFMMFWSLFIYLFFIPEQKKSYCISQGIRIFPSKKCKDLIFIPTMK